MERSMNDIMKTCEVIEKEHPEFESLDGDERVKLFGKLFNEIHKE